ncbi:MAG: LysR family transcriptional regulator [Xanthomonadales bacterium]|nr:LysR family transcriptional regulator [Xanthomonadales bacterium]MDH4020085.1 LysR family transcriptional regulator [Xanthomonadales bacterium]
MGQLEDMSVFVRIVEAGGIGKAADQMGMAKSGVSRRLGALESRLGVTLINRTTRSSSLTNVGREYYQRAVKLIGDVSELDSLATSEGNSLDGQLRLAAPLSFGLAHLSSALDEFAGDHPGLSIKIDFSDRQVDLIEQGADLAIRISELGDSSLQARRICPVRLVLCASPSYLAKNGTPRKPGDLKNHQVLAYTLGSGNTIKLCDQRGNEQLIHTTARIAANNGDFLHDMALANHGIAALPTFIVWQSLSSRKLVPVLESYTLPTINAWAVYPQTRYLSQRARQLIDFLVARFGDKPYWDDN